VTAALPDTGFDQSIVPFHTASITEEDVAGVVDVLRSGWLTTGKRCHEFERDFAHHLGGHVQAVTVNSCTSALHLALEAVGVGAGDFVLTTPNTFTATSEVVRYLGAHPVFADIDVRTGNLTAATVTAAFDRLPADLRPRVKALLPVHFGGLPCAMQDLTALAERHGWALVDDAAHALPASHRGVPIGRWGDATAFSFYATKTLCTGEGGMLVSSRPELVRRARTMRLHGIDADVFDRYTKVDAWRYRVVAAGFKYNMTDIAAALGISQLRRLHAMRDRRAAIALEYDAAFAGDDRLALPAAAPPGDEHAWHLYPLRLLAGADVRDATVRQLAQLGVVCSVHFIPLHLQPYYRDTYRLRPQDLPSALLLYGQELSLPLFPDMTPEQVQRVIDAVPVALDRALSGRS
jgi:dTDP-4-amino-4,6-dideoxygalactose transaminase